MKKNIFLFSNAFTARTLTFQMEYVFNIPINTIFLMAENHHKDETFFVGENSHVCICNTFDECINRSDMIIVAKDQIVPHFIDKKDCLIIDSPWKSKNDYKTDIHAIPKLDYLTKPVIVILSMGNYTDQYCIEILVNKILSEKNAKVMQFFSPETKTILSALSQSEYLNPNLCDVQNNDYDIIVLSIKGITNDSQLFRILKDVSPDVLILCVNYSFSKTIEIEHYFKYICNIGAIVKSPYISYEVVEGKTYPVFCGFEKSNFFKNSLDKNLEHDLRTSILQRVYLPDSIYIL